MLVILRCDSRHGIWVVGTARSLCYRALHSESPGCCWGSSLCYWPCSYVPLSFLPRGEESLSGPMRSWLSFPKRGRANKWPMISTPPSLTIFVEMPILPTALARGPWVVRWILCMPLIRFFRVGQSMERAVLSYNRWGRTLVPCQLWKVRHSDVLPAGWSRRAGALCWLSQKSCVDYYLKITVW